MATADRLGKERRSGHDLHFPPDQLRLEAKERHRVGDKGGSEIGFLDRRARVADEQAMRRKCIDLLGAVRAARFRRPGQRASGADQIVDHEHGGALDIPNQQVASHHARAAALL
jgi:hypothetical protein